MGPIPSTSSKDPQDGPKVISPHISNMLRSYITELETNPNPDREKLSQMSSTLEELIALPDFNALQKSGLQAAANEIETYLNKGNLSLLIKAAHFIESALNKF